MSTGVDTFQSQQISQSLLRILKVVLFFFLHSSSKGIKEFEFVRMTGHWLLCLAVFCQRLQGQQCESLTKHAFIFLLQRAALMRFVVVSQKAPSIPVC